MDLGDFFKAAGRARPVNPKAVTFTAICKDEILPGGMPNPHGARPVAAQIDACLVYCTFVEIDQARSAARAALRARHVDKKKMPLPYDQADMNVEELYQQLQLTIRTFDPRTRAAGDLLFPDAESMRALVSITEANRLMGVYEAYVKAEHPEVVDDETFRESEKAGG